LHDEIDEAAGSERLRRLREEIDAGIAACRESCDYFAVCGGGSPSNKYFETGRFDGTETLHCRLTRQVMTDVALNHLEAAPLPVVAAGAANGSNHGPGLETP